MQQFAKEISRIRASAGSASSSSDIPLKALPEEVRCLGLVADAEKWLNKAKKLMQGSAVRRGTKLTRLRLLHDEGAQIPINFETELRPLKVAIAAAEQWAAQHRAVLEALGITDTDLIEQSEGVDGGEEGVDQMAVVKAEAESVAIDAASASMGDAKDPEPVLASVSYGDFANVVAAASQLVADFSLVRSVQMMNADVERWVLKVHKVCGTEPSAASSVSSAPEGSHEEEGGDSAAANARSTRSTKRRKLADASEVTSEATTAATSAEHPAGETSAGPSTTAPANHVNNKATGMISLAQLDGLIDEGRMFRVDLSEQLQQLAQVKVNAEAWERSAVQYISSHFSDSLKKVFIDYKRLTTDYTTPENGSIFPFMRRKPSALSSHSIAKGYKEESVGYLKLQHLLTEVINVRIVGERIGVEMPFHRTILVYIRLLEWIQEARNIACFLAASRRATVSTSSGATKKNAALESYAGWEDLKDPVKVKNWGDVNESYVWTLITEGAAMLAQLYQFDTDERLPSILLHYSRGLLASVKEFDELVAKEAAQAEEKLRAEEEEEEDEAAEDEMDEEEQEERAAEDEGEGKSEDEHDGESGGEGGGEGSKSVENSSSNNKKKRSSDAASRKRKSVPLDSSPQGPKVPLDSSPQGPKSTRAASGITKKKVDADFAETVNLQHFNAHTMQEGNNKSSNKRQKTTSSATSSRTAAVKSEDASAVGDAAALETPKPLLLPAVDLDLAKTARRAGAGAFLESPDAKSAKLSPSMAHFLDMWVRILKVFALRLRSAKAWAAEAQRLVGGLSLSGATDSSTLLDNNDANTTVTAGQRQH